MRSRLLSLFLFFLCLSCSEPSRLEQSLRLAGNNRPELETVLRHYSANPADSLKYKATCFLIENMPGHYSIDPLLVEKMQPIYAEHQKISERFGWKKDADWGAPIGSLKTFTQTIIHLISNRVYNQISDMSLPTIWFVRQI